MEIPVHNTDGDIVEQFQVDEAALGGVPNVELIRQAVLAHEANNRVGTAHTKTRDEVIRSRRKPWRQKHTGRARHGDRGSPIWKGGGVTHGPRPRDFRQKVNRKARRRATYSAFLAKALDGEVLAIDRLELPQPKTREMAGILGRLGVERTFLIVLSDYDETLWRCTRNIEGSAMTRWQELNAYDVIRPQRVIFTVEALRQFLDAAPKFSQDESETVGVIDNG